MPLKNICYISQEEELFLNHPFVPLEMTIKANFFCSEHLHLGNEERKCDGKDISLFMLF